MQKITSKAELENAIKILKAEQGNNWELLKEQFYIVYENMKPVNLFKKTLQDITSSPSMIDNISGTAIGLASGFLTKKVFVGASGNMFRKLIGLILQYGVTNVVIQNSQAIKSFGKILFQHFLQKKETNSQNNAS